MKHSAIDRTARLLAGVSPLALLVAWFSGLLALPSAATPGDTTWVRTFDHDFYNWADAHVQTFTFPDSGLPWQRVLLRYEIGCPGAPGDCDPWDRLGHLRLVQGTEAYEIARIVTPYDITGGTRPGTCTWLLDVTDYLPLLHGQVTLSNYIESWIGGDRGWLVTIDFAFIEGNLEYKPFRIVNLWRADYAVYGDPSRPIDDHFPPIPVDVPPDAERIKARVICTGHGQGNTHNCSEFCRKDHTLKADQAVYVHQVWRADCELNTCSPQGGTWTYDRAGWCPGDKVTPWDNDVTSSVTPGTTAIFDYDIQSYENFCRPNNPNCISGQTCADCNYNYNGHTEPIWSVQGQVVFYRRLDPAGVGVEFPGDAVGLRAARPNPFADRTRIHYAVVEGGDVAIVLRDAAGRLVRSFVRTHERGGDYALVWDGRDDAGRKVPAGIYFCALKGLAGSTRSKVLLIE